MVASVCIQVSECVCACMFVSSKVCNERSLWSNSMLVPNLRTSIVHFCTVSGDCKRKLRKHINRDLV